MRFLERWRRARGDWGFYGALALLLLLLGGGIWLTSQEQEAAESSSPVLSKEQEEAFRAPLDEKYLSRPYGAAYNVSLELWEMYPDTEYRAPAGTEVCAIAAGYLRPIVDPLRGEGIEIVHDGGLVSRYVPLGSAAQEGAVAQGARIGLVANEGALYVGLTRNGVSCSPAALSSSK